MRKAASFILTTAFLSSSCVDTGIRPSDISTTEISPLQTKPFENQLYLFQEIQEPGAAKTEYSLISEKPVLSGAMYITSKGNVIINTIHEQSDTQSYFWGKYTLTDSTLTYLLTDEYFYKGKWDASWDKENPDHSKGHTRKVVSKEVTLFRSKEDTLNFLKLYSEEEKIQAAKRYTNVKPQGLAYWPYKETEGMKFYTWFYKQIPVLAEL